MKFIAMDEKGRKDLEAIYELAKSKWKPQFADKNWTLSLREAAAELGYTRAENNKLAIHPRSLKYTSIHQELRECVTIGEPYKVWGESQFRGKGRGTTTTWANEMKVHTPFLLTYGWEVFWGQEGDSIPVD